MKVPEIYRNTVNELECMFRLTATQLPQFEGVYLLCHHQRPNNAPKKIAIQFEEGNDIGFDVYDYAEDLEYENIPGQFPNSIGPALIKNVELIYPYVEEMVRFSDLYHNK